MAHPVSESPGLPAGHRCRQCLEEEARSGKGGGQRGKKGHDHPGGNRRCGEDEGGPNQVSLAGRLPQAEAGSGVLGSTERCRGRRRRPPQGRCNGDECGRCSRDADDSDPHRSAAQTPTGSAVIAGALATNPKTPTPSPLRSGGTRPIRIVPDATTVKPKPSPRIAQHAMSATGPSISTRSAELPSAAAPRANVRRTPIRAMNPVAPISDSTPANIAPPVTRPGTSGSAPAARR